MLPDKEADLLSVEELMIDFHAHFLPNMDDGSSSFSESIQMLKLSYGMGINTIISTSHYFSNHEDIDGFLLRRDARMQNLIQLLEGIDDIPQIVTGAEVSYFPGISSVKGLKKLCVGNTKYMLLEMPFCDWSSLTMREVRSLITNRGITPILAHIERYFPYQQRKNDIEELLDLGVAIQANAEALIEGCQKRSVLKLLRERKIHLLGSDCHNMVERKPNLDCAIKIIENEIGYSCIQRIDMIGQSILDAVNLT